MICILYYWPEPATRTVQFGGKKKETFMFCEVPHLLCVLFKKKLQGFYTKHHLTPLPAIATTTTSNNNELMHFCIWYNDDLVHDFAIHNNFTFGLFSKFNRGHLFGCCCNVRYDGFSSSSSDDVCMVDSLRTEKQIDMRDARLIKPIEFYFFTGLVCISILF